MIDDHHVVNVSTAESLRHRDLEKKHAHVAHALFRKSLKAVVNMKAEQLEDIPAQTTSWQRSRELQERRDPFHRVVLRIAESLMGRET